MKQVVTAKLKLYPTTEQAGQLRSVSLAYREGLNYVSRYAFEHGKTSNQHKLQAGTYAALRAEFGLPSQLACSVCRQAGASYKALWTKQRHNSQHRATGITCRRYKGLDKAPKYTSATVTYNYPRDYSFKQGRTVSINTLSGRAVMRYDGYNKHVELSQRGSQLGEAKLWYGKQSHHFYLLVTIEVEVADLAPAQHGSIVDVDVGLRYLAVAATITNQSAFYSGRQVKQTSSKYLRIRKRLQRKDTRAATRRQAAISGRERQFRLNVNHCIAKSIVSSHPQSIIGIEDLTGIRERTERRHSEKASGKQRRANQHKSSWSFAELHDLISYKAALCGSKVVAVDADYTSKACLRCGYTDGANRSHQGLLFVCVGCGYQLHADLVGARNIAMRTLLIRQCWMSTGELSSRPM